MTASTDTPARYLELEYVPPGILLLDRNVRLHTSADQDLIESIRAHGVLQPIVAVRTAQDGLRVKFGHRRTVGALAAELDQVPVLVAGDEATDDPGQIDRVLEQIAENDARQALTQLDRVNAVEQLTAFGLTATQIAARTRRPRVEVEAAQKVAGSDSAKGVLLAKPDLDLVQAAALAEFDDDPDTQTAALAVIESGYGIEHRLQQLRDQRQERALLVAAAEKAGELGITVLDGNVGESLGYLSASEEDRPNPLTLDTHQDCPGHAARIVWRYGPVNTAAMLPIDPDAVVLSAVQLLEEATVEEACSVCGCTEDAPCTGGQPDDEDPDPDDTCYWWHENVDPKNPGDDVSQCSYCVAPGGGVREERRRRPVEAVNLPGDEQEPVILRGKWLGPDWRCTDPTRYGHVSTYGGSVAAGPKKKVADMAPEEAEKARAQRRDVIESNKAWKSTVPVRRKWLREFLTRKTAPKGTGAFLVAVLADHGLTDGPMGQGRKLAHELLGVKHAQGEYGKPGPVTEAAVKATDARATVLALGYALALCEDQTDTATWRRKLPLERTYFRFLALCGYELADVEKRVIDGEKAED
jgi:ParB family chromosome partitioning protein